MAVAQRGPIDEPIDPRGVALAGWRINIRYIYMLKKIRTDRFCFHYSIRCHVFSMGAAVSFRAGGD